MCRERWGLTRFLSLLTAAIGCLAQTSPMHASLPAPTGRFGIGRVTLLCEDPSRIEPLDPKVASRRIMVDVWYPAEPPPAKTSDTAAYLDFRAFEHALGADGLKKQLGAAYDAVKAGVSTHATAAAPFAHALRRTPLLIFSPGGGMIRELYTAQMEDLASHGYVLAAVTHSYDGFLTVFPDGSYISYNPQRWPHIPSFEGEANLNQIEWHTKDLLAVLDELSRIDSDPDSRLPFAGRLDLAHIGAFGHSFGGVAAAHACQESSRIQACLNQDGAMAMKPFYPDVRGWGMDQAFMFLERPPNRQPLSDADLAEMKVTRARATQIIARLNGDRDRILRNTGEGSYRVLLRRDMTTHMDFSDLAVLGAAGGTELEMRTSTMRVVRLYTRAFFDRYLRGLTEPLLDRGSDPLIESIERFAPAKRPN